MIVYVLVVHDSLSESFEVRGVYESKDLAELEMEDLMNTSLSVSAYVEEKEVI